MNITTDFFTSYALREKVEALVARLTADDPDSGYAVAETSPGHFAVEVRDANGEFVFYL